MAPSQVMKEAGKQTTEWVGALKGTKPTTPAANDRQGRKDNLRPMPQARSARRENAPQQTPADTPQSIVAQMRKARGQMS